MDRSSILATLRAHEVELRALGVRSLALFGSFARETAGPDSDVDLLGRLDESKHLSLIDVIHIENRLADLLGRRVDLIDEGSLDSRIEPAVRETLVDAF